ncbi:hypothetical protein ACHAO1_011145 [Botrytis cinerea]
MPFEIYLTSLTGHIKSWIPEEDHGKYNLKDFKKLKTIAGEMETETVSSGKVEIVKIRMDRYEHKKTGQLLHVLIPTDTIEESRSVHSGGDRAWSHTYRRIKTVTEWGQTKPFISFTLGDFYIGKNNIVRRNGEGDFDTKHRSGSRGGNGRKKHGSRGDGLEEEHGHLDGDEKERHRSQRNRLHRRSGDYQDNRGTSRDRQEVIDPPQRHRSRARETSRGNRNENGRSKNGRDTKRTSKEKGRSRTHHTQNDSESEDSSSEAETSIHPGTEVSTNQSVEGYRSRDGSEQGEISEVSTGIDVHSERSQKLLTWNGSPVGGSVKHESRDSSKRGSSSRGSLNQSEASSKVKSTRGTGSVTSAQRTPTGSKHSSVAQSIIEEPGSPRPTGVIPNLTLRLTKPNLNLLRQEGDSQGGRSSTAGPGSVSQDGQSSVDYEESVRSEEKRRHRRRRVR